MNEVLKQLLPNTRQIVAIVKNQLDLPVNDDGTITIDLSKIVLENVDLGERVISFQLPFFDITQFLPEGLDLSWLDDLNLNIPGNPLFDGSNVGDNSGLKFTDLLKGKITIKVDFMTQFLDQTDLTSLDIPIDDIVNSLLNVSYFPKALAHNFTVVHSYSESMGKTPDNMGNTAIVDCNFLNQILFTTFEITFNKIVDINPFYYVFLKQIGNDIRATIKGVNFCEYAMNING